jgi:hypothetical protein
MELMLADLRDGQGVQHRDPKGVADRAAVRYLDTVLDVVSMMSA